MCIHSYFLSQDHPRQIRPEPKQKLCPTDPSESVLVEIARGGGGRKRDEARGNITRVEARTGSDWRGGPHTC